MFWGSVKCRFTDTRENFGPSRLWVGEGGRVVELGGGWVGGGPKGIAFSS